MGLKHDLDPWEHFGLQGREELKSDQYGIETSSRLGLGLLAPRLLKSDQYGIETSCFRPPYRAELDVEIGPIWD